MTAEESEEATLQMYEQMFANRYTEADPEYQKVVSSPIPPQPCVQGYFTRSRRNFDSNRGGRGRGQGHWENRDNRDNRDNQDRGNWNRNYQQHRGHNNRPGNGWEGSRRQFY